MFKKFLKSKLPDERPFDRYKRLISNADEGSFLDIDTTLIIADRDEIDENNLSNKNSIDVHELKELDIKFKHLMQISVDNFLIQISNNSSNNDYLRPVLIDVHSFGKSEPLEKWWYHMIPDELIRNLQ